MGLCLLEKAMLFDLGDNIFVVICQGKDC